MSNPHIGKEKRMETSLIETNVEAKKPYTRPQLTCYGDMAELTQGFTGTPSDGLASGSEP
jgi:hypothetical protein